MKENRYRGKHTHLCVLVDKLVVLQTGVFLSLILVMLQACGSDDGYTHAILGDLVLSLGKLN